MTEETVMIFREMIAILKKWKGLNFAYFLKSVDCLINVYQKLVRRIKEYFLHLYTDIIPSFAYDWKRNLICKDLVLNGKDVEDEIVAYCKVLQRNEENRKTSIIRM